MFKFETNPDGSFACVDIRNSKGEWRDRLLHRFHNGATTLPAGLRRKIRKQLRKQFSNGASLVRRTLKAGHRY